MSRPLRWRWLIEMAGYSLAGRGDSPDSRSLN